MSITDSDDIMDQQTQRAPAGEQHSIDVRRENGVVSVRLSRPKTRNAITEADIDELIGQLRIVDDSPRDRALLLTGTDDAFCAGIDLSVPLRRSMPRFMRRVGELAALLHHLSVPTVAAVRGPAVGLGFSLALACDLILADRTAYFCMPFHRRGLALDGGATWLLPKRIGVGAAKEVALFAERIEADRAQVLGIINRVVESEQLDSITEQWMTRLAGGPPHAQRMSKELLNFSDTMPFEAALAAEANAQSVAFAGKEAKEGVKAFIAKREPVFPDA